MSRGKIVTLLIVAGILLVLFTMFRSCQTAGEPPTTGLTSHQPVQVPAFAIPA